MKALLPHRPARHRPATDGLDGRWAWRCTVPGCTVHSVTADRDTATMAALIHLATAHGGG